MARVRETWHAKRPSRRSGRARQQFTWEEFARNLEGFFPGSATRILTEEETGAAWEMDPGGAYKLMRMTQDGRRIILFVLDGGTGSPVRAIELEFRTDCSANELKLAHIFARVFNNDLNSSEGTDNPELWAGSQITRFSRTIARFTTFTTRRFLLWLQVVENATSLTYEGNPFAVHLLLTWNKSYVTDRAGEDFVKFKIPISRESALLGEKWVRALTYSGAVALVAVPRGGGVIGVVTLADAEEAESVAVLHEDLRALTGYVRPGVALISANALGDMYVVLADNLTFIKRQGRWRYLNPRLLLDRLRLFVPAASASAILSIALSLSYERRGALLGVVGREDISFAVPDHGASASSNAALRAIATKLNPLNAAHNKLLRNVAGIDGAIIFGRDGEVLDIACMIATPSGEQLDKRGCRLGPSQPGARSTAAQNCSVFGLAIKISDDGPITVYEAGKLLMTLG